MCKLSVDVLGTEESASVKAYLKELGRNNKMHRVVKVPDTITELLGTENHLHLGFTMLQNCVAVWKQVGQFDGHGRAVLAVIYCQDLRTKEDCSVPVSVWRIRYRGRLDPETNKPMRPVMLKLLREGEHEPGVFPVKTTDRCDDIVGAIRELLVDCPEFTSDEDDESGSSSDLEESFDEDDMSDLLASFRLNGDSDAHAAGRHATHKPRVTHTRPRSAGAKSTNAGKRRAVAALTEAPYDDSDVSDDAMDVGYDI